MDPHYLGPEFVQISESYTVYVLQKAKWGFRISKVFGLKGFGPMILTFTECTATLQPDKVDNNY